MFKSLGVAQAKNRNKKEGIEMTDQEYMLRAIQLAKKGEVIVKDGRIIGEGYHKKYGELHAERNAIASLTESAEGAVIYVTLEPCCHHGKTPPCTEAIIEQKIRKVVIGSRDPNPKVAGKGVQMLREAGVTVVEDFMREECDQLNPVFFHYITTKTPYVVMKYAMMGRSQRRQEHQNGLLEKRQEKKYSICGISTWESWLVLELCLQMIRC